MNSFQLTCFLTVAETLNFARTAERLNITQPAVTHQIRALETELGTRLFHRTTHSVELTRAGFLLLDDARSIVGTSNRVKKRFESLHEQAFTEFIIGCHGDGLPRCLPDVLRAFSGQYPEVHLSVRLPPTQAILYRNLADENVPVILSIKEPDVPPRLSGFYQELTQSPLVYVCSPDHPLAGRRTITQEALDQYRLILFDPMKSSFLHAHLRERLMSERQPKNLIFCESTTAALLLVRSGCGVFLMPEIFVPEDPSIVSIPMENAESVSFGMYYDDAKPGALLNHFLKLMTEAFR